MERHRTAVSVAALALALIGGGAGPAFGDDTPPPPLLPPGVTAPPAHITPSSGPTYVITPGSPGDELGQPTSGSVPTEQPTKKPRSHRTGTQGVPPTVTGAPESGTAGTGVSTAEATWWTVGAGALLVLVLTETAWVVFRRRSA